MRYISPSTVLPPACATAAEPAACRQRGRSPRHRLTITRLSALWALAVMAALPARALPTDFNDKVESALLCRSDWSTAFWQSYFDKHLQASIRDWGEARWWSSQGAQLGGASTVEIFTNVDTSRALMLGVLIAQPVEEVKRTLEQNLRVAFKPVQTVDGLRYVSDTLSVLVGTTNQQTKWYCAKWNLGNRERVQPLAPQY